VNTSTTRKDPKEVLEVKVFREDIRDDLHCNLEVGETAFANVGALAARTHIIVIVHINIEDHLFLHGHKGFLVASVVSIWRNIVNCSNINLVWHSIDQSLSELLGILEAQVATIDIVS